MDQKDFNWVGKYVKAVGSEESQAEAHKHSTYVNDFFKAHFRRLSKKDAL